MRGVAVRVATVRRRARPEPPSDPIVLDDDLLVAGDNAAVLAAAAGRRVRSDLHGSAVQHRPGAGAADAGGGGRSPSAGTVSGSAAGATARRLLRSLSYDDAFADYLAFLEPRLQRARALLAPHGTLYFHIDYREAHYCKLLLDEIFGRDAFLNELIWGYDYGAKPRRRWPAKHDTILVYVRTPGAHFRRRRGRARAVHGSRAGQRREGGARQAADRRLVPHDRPDQRPREDRLPDPEARGGAAPDRRRLLAAGRLVPGPVRRLGHARRGLPGARPPLRPDRLEPGGDRGDAGAARADRGPPALFGVAVDERHELDRLELPAD